MDAVLPADFVIPRLPFPQGPSWEITRDNAGRWDRGRFVLGALINMADHPGIDLLSDPVAELVFDIILWRSWTSAERHRRGVDYLEDHLLPGREGWGELARELREMQAERRRDEERARQAKREAKAQRKAAANGR